MPWNILQKHYGPYLARPAVGEAWREDILLLSELFKDVSSPIQYFITVNPRYKDSPISGYLAKDVLSAPSLF